jgi:hypothetical protein
MPNVSMPELFPFAMALFPIAWVAMSFLLAHLGGWAALAHQYPDVRTVGDDGGPTYYLQSGSVGLVNYGSCLSIRVYKKGLRLAVLLPFRIGHPPLFIPWDRFHSATVRRPFLSQVLETTVGTPEMVKVVLPIWTSEHLLPPVKD